MWRYYIAVARNRHHGLFDWPIYNTFVWPQDMRCVITLDQLRSTFIFYLNARSLLD